MNFLANYSQNEFLAVAVCFVFYEQWQLSADFHKNGSPEGQDNVREA